MLRTGLALATVLVPAQILFGHLNGDYVVKKQPSKVAAIEGRWLLCAGPVPATTPGRPTANGRLLYRMPAITRRHRRNAAQT